MELISILNEQLSVTLDADGAVLHSIRMGGVEYLWQGDPRFWPRRDLNLFPYIGRLTDGQYIYRGKKYSLPIHGFCVGTKFEVSAKTESSVCFTLTDSEATRKMYPFSFVFNVNYALEDSSIIKTCTVMNTGRETMHFGIGGHPGFNVPLGGEGDFTDWQLRFGSPCSPERMELDPSNYRFAGTSCPYPLQDGAVLPLEHSLFDRDAIILGNAARSLTLESSKSAHSVTLSFPDMPFVGFWHAVKTEAPYVCIEPWVSLPSHSAYMEDIEKQEYLIALDEGKEYKNVLRFDIK